MTMSIVDVHISKEDIEQRHAHFFALSCALCCVISLKREREREKKESDMKNACINIHSCTSLIHMHEFIHTFMLSIIVVVATVSVR